METSSGSVIRQYEDIIAKFSALFGRATDVYSNQKDNLLKRVEKAYDAQKAALERKVWGGALLQGVGGAAGFGAEALTDGTTWKNVVQITSKVLPKMGDVVAAQCDATSLGGQKEFQLANAAMTSEDQSLNRLAQVQQSYTTTMQRIDELKSRAQGS